MERSGYSVIDKEISSLKGNDKINKILIYAFIKSWKKHNLLFKDIDNNYISDITYKQTKENLNMQVNRIIPQLISEGYFDNVYKQYNCEKERNIYTFKEEKNYFFIDNRYFDDTTKENNKLKGFILLLKCHCINGTNKYISYKPIKGKCNISELAALLDIDRKTTDKYIKLCIDANWLQHIEGGLLITNPYIKADIIKNDTLTHLYNVIYNYCISKGVVPPRREDKALKQIYFSYPVTESEYKVYKDKNILCSNYLPLALEKRLPELPKDINWQYLITALTNRKDTLKRKEFNIIIL